ncbi:hypothetical protein ACLOJK_039675 [Asimina triloba]
MSSGNKTCLPLASNSTNLRKRTPPSNFRPASTQSLEIGILRVFFSLNPRFLLPQTEMSPNAAGIGDLPENVLVHIISFLPITDAVATSFLSKAWRNLWTYSPCLVFDFDQVTPPHDGSDDGSDFDEDDYRGFNFTGFVAQALHLHHHANLRSLAISFVYEDFFAPDVDKWVQIAARNNVQNLRFHFSIADYCLPFEDDDNMYNLSLSALSSPSLTTFSLRGCRIVPSTDVAAFRSLRILSLVQVELTDETIVHLTAGCPELDTLTLNSCAGIRHLKISSSALKNLTISFDDSLKNPSHGFEDTVPSSVEIEAPNLISFDCSHYLAYDFRFRDVSSLVNASVIFSDLIRHFHDMGDFDPFPKIIETLTPARRLTTESWWVWKTLHRQKILPYHLEYLELTTGFSEVEFQGLAVILNHSPNLRTVIIRHEFERADVSYDTEVLESYFRGSLPQLKTVKIYSCRANEKEIELEVELLKLLLKHGTILKKMILSVSFLPIKEAIATSFLSKAWRNLWTFSPSLTFELDGRVEIFTPFVDQALRCHHHANLRSLSITCYYHDGGVHHVDNWVRIVSQNSVLDFIPFDWDGDFPDADYIYCLSLSILSTSTSLTTLNLCG